MVPDFLSVVSHFCQLFSEGVVFLLLFQNATTAGYMHRPPVTKQMGRPHYVVAVDISSR